MGKEIEVSDEDLQFVGEDSDYAGLVSKLDSHSITTEKHGGEAAVEAVKRIAELVKAHNCQLLRDSIYRKNRDEGEVLAEALKI